ncbi:MAG: hypothetical protein CFE34_06795 [Rhodobacteraceae bacterium PARR1]|nr:MAG: hypothetical protein CFE34_06795 [Rhodobacteraceae bacterium PARR1]
MRSLPVLRGFVLATVASVFLTACDSAEERAEQYYQSGLALLQAGKDAQASVEFLNALQYMPAHDGARRGYADALLVAGKTGDAYVQYVRYVEYHPDAPDVRRKLAQMAIIAGNWAEADRHGREALRLDPTAPGAASIRIALDYRASVSVAAGQVDAQRRQLFTEAEALLRQTPDDPIARRVTIDYLITGPDPVKALPEVEAALAAEPADYALNGLKLQLLSQMGDVAAMAAQLDRMVALFPEDRELAPTLLDLLVRDGQIDRAEAFLRGRTAAPDADVAGNLALIQFLRTHRGPEAGFAQIDAATAAAGATTAATVYRGLRVLFEFEDAQALADGAAQAKRADVLRAAITELSADDPFLPVLQTGLARMQLALGQTAEARVTVDTVIAGDRTFADALRLRAAMALDDDRPSDAINDLRAALDQNPRDVEALLLLAQAHQADGSTDLAGDRLAEANAASGNAPDVALRYAGFLVEQGRARPAEAVLSDALRLNPDDLQLLTARADLMLRDGRRDEAAVLVDRIATLPDPAARPVVQQFRVLLLEAENRTEESIAMLRDMADGPDGTVATQIGLVNRLVAIGDSAGALAHLQQAVARFPDDPRLGTLNAALLLQQGQTAAAETALAALVQTAPGFVPALSMYDEHLSATGRADQAEAMLRAAVAFDPASAQLRGILALRLEAQGKTDAAIAEYETILAAGGNNPLAANNLVSLLVWTREDAESLTKAATFARQIAGVDDPAVQDTLGWLAYRQARFGDAVLALSEAARALPDDPLVQYRYARALEAVDRKDAAAAQYAVFLSRRAAAPAAQVADAEARLAALRPAVAP